MANQVRTRRAADDMDGGQPQARGYPRKRATIACNVCRLRKTRCDGKKPSCSFCGDLGISCQYRGPNEDNWSVSEESATTINAFARLEQRLVQFEENVTSILREQGQYSVPNTSARERSSSFLLDLHDTGLSSRFMIPESDRSVVATCHHSSSTARVDFAFRQTRIEAKTARPSFLTFSCPFFLHFENWDDTEEFYDDELGLGELLFDQVQSLRGQQLDTVPPTCWRLQQSFFRNFLRWIPIFDMQTCVEHIRIAKSQNFEGTDLPTCMSMFILAVGAISDERRDMISDRLVEEVPPGLEYFARGSEILERFSLKSCDVTVMTCRIVQASYFQFLVRPLQVWNTITQVSRDCMHVLSSDRGNRMDASTKESLHRVFWACSMIQHEIEATLKMHPTGLRHYHSAVSLPASEKEEEELYYFLAQASLRRLLTEAIDAVGFYSGKVIYAPVIVLELRAQLQEWYQHLPPSVRFSLDGSLLFDTRNAHLRSLYIGVHVVMTWPGTLRCIEWGIIDQRDLGQNRAEWEKVRSEAQECLRNCSLYLEVGEELLMGRTMGLHSTLWSTYAIMSMLILVHNSPVLAFAPETLDTRAIIKGYNALKLWSHMPMVARGLARTRTMMIQAGIFTENEVQ